jgi:hypothetical protein
MHTLFALLLLALFALSTNAFSPTLMTARALRLATTATTTSTRLSAEPEGGGPPKRKVVKYDNLGDPIYEGESSEGGGLNILGRYEGTAVSR